MSVAAQTLRQTSISTLASTRLRASLAPPSAICLCSKGSTSSARPRARTVQTRASAQLWRDAERDEGERESQKAEDALRGALRDLETVDGEVQARIEAAGHASTSSPLGSRPAAEHEAALGQTSSSSSQAASAYLFRLAEEEERGEQLAPSEQPDIPELREKAWDGEEPQDRLIRRMLEDTYKPLRVKGHKKRLPEVAPLPSQLFTTTETKKPVSSEPGNFKNPWDYDYLPKPKPTLEDEFLPIGSLEPTMAKTRRTRQQRVMAAREATLDYVSGAPEKAKATIKESLGDKRAREQARAPEGRMFIPNPRMMGSFIDEKIEQARRDGLFKDVKGRGRPIARDVAEGNPFIAREEFLLNRIVRQNNAAPPWIEAQRELDEALQVFRAGLRDSWVRRVVRIKSLDALTPQSIAEVKQGWRDAEWQARERSFHEASLVSVNALLRRYNAIAPYAVRRAPYMLDAELERCYRECAEHIEAELTRRLHGKTSQGPIGGFITGRDEGGEEGPVQEVPAVKMSMWRTLKDAVLHGFVR